MSLNKMSKVELELLSYTDIAYMLLKENKKTMNTPTIFKQICELLEIGEEEYALKIGDFYTSLTTDRRFLLLENAEWDLKENHVVKVEVEEDEMEEVEDVEEMEETEELADVEEMEDLEESIEEDLEDLDDDMEDFSIAEVEETEE